MQDKRRTTHNPDEKLMAIGHLGDLKMLQCKWTAKNNVSARIDQK